MKTIATIVYNFIKNLFHSIILASERVLPLDYDPKDKEYFQIINDKENTKNERH